MRSKKAASMACKEAVVVKAYIGVLGGACEWARIRGDEACREEANRGKPIRSPGLTRLGEGSAELVGDGVCDTPPHGCSSCKQRSRTTELSCRAGSTDGDVGGG